MKQYWEIPGPNKAPNEPCIAFRKYDGSNFRAEWSKKRGWYKFGTKTQMIDRTHPTFGAAVDVFLRDWSEPLAKVFTDHRDFRHVQSMIAFSEFFGEKSFAGWHDLSEPIESKKTVLFDIAKHQSGLLVPREFVRTFGHLPIAQIIYEGNFNHQFRKDVMDGRYPVEEGVVAKGVLPRKRGNENHGLWMAKVKTKAWIDKLRNFCREHPECSKELSDNLKEQEI